MLKISPNENKVGKILNIFSMDTLKLEQGVQEILKVWVVSKIVFKIHVRCEMKP